MHASDRLAASDDVLLHELEPVAGRLLERHLGGSKEWFPHTLVPWSKGRDFAEDWTWTPEEADETLPSEVRSALFVNLLTEDNLPYYFRTIEGRFGRDDAWGEWSRRWTAEEGRHSIVLRDYLTVTRAIDPVELERGRMAQVSTGQVPEPQSVADALVYVALQELATRISHLNTGRAITDRTGYEVLKRIASDENRHHLFYRDLVTAALTVDPTSILLAVERQVTGFQMPGTGIVDFAAHSRAIAKAGIYDFAVHYDQILAPVLLTTWRLDRLEGLDAEAEQAREATMRFLARLEKVARRARRQRGDAPVEPEAALAGG